MPFTDAELADIADNVPIQEGFGCEIDDRIQGIIDRLNSTGDLGCEMVEPDGLDSDLQLAEWIEAATRFVETLPHK